MNQEIADAKPDQTAGRISAIDGLRGAAIIMVVLFHTQLFDQSLRALRVGLLYSKAVGIGWVGVDLFFVISGFLITGILIDSASSQRYYKTFFARRTIRIFPVYYSSLFLFFVVAATYLRLTNQEVALSTNIIPSSQFWAWTYTLNWRIALLSFASIPVFIQHFWSLAIEEQFYILWPFIVRRFLQRGFLFVCGLLVIISLASRAALLLLHKNEAAYVATFCRLDALAIGASIAFAKRDKQIWPLMTRHAKKVNVLALTLLIAMIGATGHTSFSGRLMGSIGITLWGTFFGSYLIVLLRRSHGGTGIVSGIVSFTGNPFFRWFGKYSYSLYIFHQPLIIMLYRLGVSSGRLAALCQSPIAGVLLMNCIVFASASLISLASWHLLEKHFLNLKRLPAFNY
jgi:peptidoglycan/LPS O-acetylase OafA/YrhL